MKLPAGLNNLVEFLQRLPGVGPKSALRMAFYLLQTPDSFNNELSKTIGDLKRNVFVCYECFSVSEGEICEVCQDKNRNKQLICVVERADDVQVVENLGGFKGVYHVLGGAINPLNHIGPEDLRILELFERVKKNEVLEVIVATNLSLEGEATALYIKSKLNKDVKVTRIGSGLPMGADLGYADMATLQRAMDGRREI
ncbi:MAG: recombination mediator RecR [Candidatus Shapirobacteria bacterium]